MKKRVYLLALVFLVCLPFIHAEDNETEQNSVYSIEFNIDKSRIQLGDNILITGKVYKNNELLEDQVNMKFYFTSPSDRNEVYLSIFDGSFSLTPRLRDLVSGDYVISIDLIDLNGEVLHEFYDLHNLYVDNQLLLEVSLREDQLNPGDELRIEGDLLRNLDRESVPSGIVTIELDGIEHITEISGGDLDHTIILTDNVESNYHDAKVKIVDSFGNSGEILLSYYIIPQEESLEISLDKKSFSPGEDINIKGILYDQAHSKLVGDIKVEVYNPKGKKIFDEVTSTGSVLVYSLAEDALPGEWKVRIESDRLESEKFVEIVIAQGLEIEVIAQNMKVRNSGNVDYNEPLVLVASNGDYEKVHEFRTNLNPGENFTVELFRYLDDGEYNILVRNTNQSVSVNIYDERGIGSKTGDFFGAITGQAVHLSGSKNSDVASYFFGIILILLVVFLSFFFKVGIPFKKPKRKEVKGDKFKTKSMHSKILKKSEEEREIEDFKTRILKDIEKSGVNEEKKKEDKPFNVQPFFPMKKEEPSTKKPERVSFDKPLRKE